MLSRIAAALAILALLPVLYAEPLRFAYEQWCAHQLSKVRRPGLVVLGDSIVAGGRMFGALDTINLGENGLEAHQIAARMPTAISYRPRWIMADGGTNDAVDGPADLARVRAAWRTMCAAPNLIAVLPTPSRFPVMNARLAPIRQVIREECRRTIDLSELAGADGLLRPEYSLDGTHLTGAAYPIWRNALHQALR